MTAHTEQRERQKGLLKRDPSIDAVRAWAIIGVVGGHWLVTGLVIGPDGVLRQASPLTAMPAFAPVTWVLQTLGLFFFAGGYAAARSLGRPRPLVPARLLRPVAALAGALALGLAAGSALGVPTATLHTVAKLVASPLWFLVPYLLLAPATAVLARLVDRAGVVVALPAVAVVAASDAALVPGWLAVGAAWSVPWILGVALARGRLAAGAAMAMDDVALARGRLAAGAATAMDDVALARGRLAVGAAMTVGGVAAMAVLIAGCGYPASAVGVPGDGRSNLAPPSLLAVALAVAQIGLFLLLRARFARRSGAVIAWLNRSAVPVYLGHQSVLLLVAAAAALVDRRAPGLLSAPDGPVWAAQRILWLPVLTAVLVGVARAQRTRKSRRASPRTLIRA
jgi:hypothetical protein